MELHNIDVPVKGAGDEINLSIYSDMHLGSTHCAYDELKAHMDRRAKLKNARFVFLGDNWDFVLPRDLARHVPSESSTRGVDAIIDVEIQMAVKMFKKYPIDLILLGNHEYEVLKRHSTDPVRRIARELGARYGGYAGFLRYVFRPVEKDGKWKKVGFQGKRSSTLLLHHGAGGGKVSKGYGWARDFGRGFEGWDLFAYGHNHQSNIHKELITRMTPRGKIESRNIYYVNTGTWNQTVKEGLMGYGERRGYAPTPLNAPLVRFTPTSADGVKIAVVMEDE